MGPTLIWQTLLYVLYSELLFCFVFSSSTRRECTKQHRQIQWEWRNYTRT